MTLSSLRSSKTSSSKRNRQKTAGIRRYTCRFSVLSAAESSAPHTESMAANAFLPPSAAVSSSGSARRHERAFPFQAAGASSGGALPSASPPPFFISRNAEPLTRPDQVARRALPAALATTQTGRSHGNASTTGRAAIAVFRTRAEKQAALQTKTHQPRRYRPVTLSAQAAISDGAPDRTIRPPSSPPPGPMSMI